MIEGTVNDAYEPLVALTLQGSEEQTREIEAVIDTGFTGFLTVTPALAAQLGMRYRSRGWATLADGSETAFDIYDVTIIWDGEPRRVEADVADVTPLIGMRLLDGHNLNIAVQSGGRVVIGGLSG